MYFNIQKYFKFNVNISIFSVSIFLLFLVQETFSYFEIFLYFTGQILKIYFSYLECWPLRNFFHVQGEKGMFSHNFLNQIIKYLKAIY